LKLTGADNLGELDRVDDHARGLDDPARVMTVDLEGKYVAATHPNSQLDGSTELEVVPEPAEVNERTIQDP
jgi:hypothetical protein